MTRPRGRHGRREESAKKVKGIDVLEEFEALLEKDDRKDADEEDQRAACHLVDGDWGIEEADIHELEKMKKMRGEMEK